MIRLPGRKFRIEAIGPYELPRGADGEVDVPAATQMITSVVEGWVRENPGQYSGSTGAGDDPRRRMADRVREPGSPFCRRRCRDFAAAGAYDDPSTEQEPESIVFSFCPPHWSSDCRLGLWQPIPIQPLRGTSIRRTRSTIAPALPSPNLPDGAKPSDALRAAQGALAAGRSGEAQDALEMAETRMLDRSVALGTTGDPSDPTVSSFPRRCRHWRRMTERLACSRSDRARLRRGPGALKRCRPDSNPAAILRLMNLLRKNPSISTHGGTDRGSL